MLQGNNEVRELKLYCDEFSDLREIVENGNNQGAHICDDCGDWDYVGLPWCDEDCEGRYRLISETDLENAEILCRHEYSLDYDCEIYGECVMWKCVW